MTQTLPGVLSGSHSITPVIAGGGTTRHRRRPGKKHTSCSLRTPPPRDPGKRQKSHSDHVFSHLSRKPQVSQFPVLKKPTEWAANWKEAGNTAAHRQTALTLRERVQEPLPRGERERAVRQEPPRRKKVKATAPCSGLQRCRI